MFKLVLEKAEEPEIKLSTPAGSSKKQESFRKTSISALLTIPKPLTVWITINCRKFWNRWEYQNTLPASWETRGGQEATVKNWHETMDWFKIGKRLRQGYILPPCLLNLYATTSWKLLDWMNHKRNQDCWEKYQQPQICRWYHSNGRSEKELKSLLMKVKEES